MSLDIQVKDMTCGHCVQSITQAVQSVSPNAQVQVDLATHRVQIQGEVDQVAVLGAITDAGFTPESL